MSAVVEFKLATARHADTISQMSRALIEDGLGWSWRTERIRRYIADPNSIVLMATAKEKLLGFAIMHFSFEEAQLLLLAVAPQHQRSGIASRLLEWLEKSALTAGIRAISLQVRVSNSIGRAFYKSQGFTETGLLAGYYRGRESAVAMCKFIGFRQ